MKIIPILLLLLWSAGAVAEETLSVYQLTGATQCAEGTGVPPEQAADLLRAQGVKVISAERRKLPQQAADACGAPTGEANVMKVSAADWSAFLAKNPDAGGYGIWVFDESNIQVYRYDGTLQCGMGHEISLENMVTELEAAGVHVLTSRKDTDGLMHISVCGASTGAINVYLIDRGSLPAAQRLGYQPLVTREMTRSIKPGDGLGPPKATVESSPPPAAQEPAGPDSIPLLW
jgi:hypothetical protein